MAKTDIAWTQAVWNPITGCTKCSSGCLNCYAERMTKRMVGMEQPKYKNGFNVSAHEEDLQIPFSWKKPKSIFVNSMSDLFHEDVPIDFIKKVFEVMSNTPHHSYQVLTKRDERLKRIASKLPWSDNIWMGVSVENQDSVGRIDNLLATPAKNKMISFEPLVGEIAKFPTTGIDWIIVGGESGPKDKVRKLEAAWVRTLRDIAIKNSIPFFFKQWGTPESNPLVVKRYEGVSIKAFLEAADPLPGLRKGGSRLDGEYWHQIPNEN